MSHREIKQLLGYDTWANELVLDAVAKLSSDELNRDLTTSHESVLGTLVHLVGAEEVWLSRWDGGPSKGMPSLAEVASIDALRTRWDAVRRARDRFVDTLDDETLDREIEISTLAGKSFRHSFRHMILHVVNHSSYHRGQVVTLLRQLGAEPPATDLILYYRRTS